jgi:hypothetical protein
MPNRNLVIVHRGSEYERDFSEIAARTAEIDPGIEVDPVGPGKPRAMPGDGWSRQTLTVALNSHSALPWILDLGWHGRVQAWGVTRVG